MTGTVDWGDLPKQRVGVFISAAGRGLFFGIPPGVDQNGAVTLRAVAARKSLILPSAGPGYYPASVLLEGREVLGKAVDLFPGSTFRVTYKAATGSVHGTVETWFRSQQCS
jgi:hypothetical protein